MNKRKARWARQATRRHGSWRAGKSKVMEDPVVRKTWLIAITSACCAVGAAATTAKAGPAESLMFWKRSPETAPPASAPPAVPQTVVGGDRPSAGISPYRHPIKYLGAAISEMPLPGRSNRDSTRVASKQKKVDSISLDTPAGPPTAQLKISMAQMCERNGDIAGAREHYQEALRKTPGQVDVLRAAARMEDRLGQMQLAENLYRQAANANPEHAGAHNDLGMCLARQGRLEASLQEIEKAVSMQPENQLYRNNAAVVLVEMRQDSHALAHLSAVHAGAEANYNLGQLLVMRGRSMDAAPYFAAALELNPSMQPAYDALTKLQGTVPAQAPAIASEQSVTSGAPVVAPQPAATSPPQVGAPAGPQLNFPATARNPAWSTSGYMQPGYYAPTTQPPSQAFQQVGQLPAQGADPRFSQLPGPAPQPAGYSPAGYPPAGYPPAGYPQAGYSPAGYPQVGQLPARYLPPVPGTAQPQSASTLLR